MVSTQKDPVLAVLSLSGGNDFMNTVIPYNDPLYRDYRPNLAIPEDQIIPLNDEVGLHPDMAPLKSFWDAGKLAIFLGVGYPHPSRSHFRSMDIWHTCEPDRLSSEGWLGRAIQDLDPHAGNVLTGVNFGRGLPRALVKEGVPVASVADLATYGLLTDIEGEDQRAEALDVFARMYSPAIGLGPVMDYIHDTGIYALKGADILSTAPGKYSSQVEYSPNEIGQNMKAIAQVHLANLAPASSIPHLLTTPSTPTRTRLEPSPNCGLKCLTPSKPSSTTCETTRRATKCCCCCFPSLDAGSRTTGRARTMAPAA